MSSRKDCERWAELTDRMAVGEALDRKEGEFEREHRRTCALCAGEAQLYAALGASLDESRPTPVEQLPASWAPELAPRSRVLLGRGMILTLGLSAVAAALAMGLLFVQGETSPHVESAGGPFSPPPVDLVLSAGDVSVGGEPASAGASLGPKDKLRTHLGRACLAYASEISACLKASSEVSLASPSEKDRRLSLSRGSIVCALETQAEGMTFSVETSRGTVTAKGTAFSVSYRPDSAVEVRLHEGVVEVQGKSGEKRTIHAPSTLILGDALVEIPRDPLKWQEDEELLRLPEFWSEGVVAPLDIRAEPAGAVVSLDGRELGPSPVSMLVGRGERALRVEAHGYLPGEETVFIKGARRVSLTTALEAMTPVTQEGAGSGSEKRAARDAASLLSEAQRLRKSGDYSGAARAYQALLRLYPTSAEARAGLISLGELQLSHLGDPGGALSSFQRYEKTGGGLSQEAQYGKIRALRALGRGEEARALAARFVQTYPSTAQAVSLQQWLDGG